MYLKLMEIPKQQVPFVATATVESRGPWNQVSKSSRYSVIQESQLFLVASQVVE